MKELGEFLHVAQAIVNELSEHLITDTKSLFEVEQEIVTFINAVGNLLLVEVIERVPEPTEENTVWVEGKRAVYKQMENLRMRDRFGHEIVRRRRTLTSDDHSSRLGNSNCR